MRKILLISFFFGMTSIFANQSDSTAIKAVRNLQAQIDKQQIDIQNLYTELDKEYRTYRNVKEELSLTSITIDNQKKVIDSLDKLIAKSKAEFAAIQTEINKKIDESNDTTTSKITDLDSSISKNQLYWISGLAILFLAGLIVYWLLGRRMRSNKDEMENKILENKSKFEKQIKNTRVALEEETLMLDTKLIEVLNTQLRLQNEESVLQPNNEDEGEDHSLAIKVADEIVRMKKNISRIDSKTKGVKPLLKGLERIQNNFLANGYEMINLMGANYDDRMNIDVINFIDDEDLNEGDKIITKIIRPQVNYNGKMIQKAQVDVSQN